MHLYFYARGIYDRVEIWKTLAQSHFWKFDRRNLTTNLIEHDLVQGSLRPSIFGAWEYVFPEESLAEVLSVFGIVEQTEFGNLKGLQYKTKMFALRKMFGAEAIPKKIYEASLKIPSIIALNTSTRGLNNNIIPNVDLHVIGIKKDRRQIMPEWNFEQEML